WGRAWVTPSTLTCCSAMASSSALCVRGGARLISSASSSWVNTGPGWKRNSRLAWSKMDTPMMSEGSRSAVNWLRWNSRPRVAAMARASVVLPRPGRSSISRWPPASRVVKASRTSRGLPSTSRFTWASASARAWRRCSGRMSAERGDALIRGSWRESLEASIPMDGGRSSVSWRTRLLILWAGLLGVRLWLAAHLPAFGDEAFYIQEGRRLARAYSDLPGLTAWLARLGQECFGDGLLAARLPFLLLAALLPWQVWRIAGRCFGPAVAERAALLAMLMPLAGLMGVLVLPDVPLLLAALLCADALTAMMQRRRATDALLLVLGLVLGALAHYRFIMALVAGMAGWLLAPAGRRLFREPRLWLTLLPGALAWLPLLHWNLQHHGAGLAFHFAERHPWTWQPQGLAWPFVQALLLTPLLLLALLAALREAWRRRHEAAAWPFLLGAGGVATLGWFLLGFFTDSERVSFHWPLAGWLLLCCAAPLPLWRWHAVWRRACLALAALGLLALTAYLGVLAKAEGRRALADSPAY